MSEILNCPWCDKRRATQLDYDTLQPGEGTDLCWASPECELDGDEEVVLALRLALETAEANEEKLHETNERLALDIVDAEDDRADLAEMYEATAAERDGLLAHVQLDNAVCLCGCPASEHEDNGEDGEQCEHEDHECIRVAPAVLEIVGRVRLALETATRERDEALRTVKALTPAANYCLEYKPLLLKAEHERDEAIRVLRAIATFGWYAKGAKVARAYLAARGGR